MANARAVSLAATINSTDDTRQMFEATRTLANVKRTSTISVHNENGNFVATDNGKAAVIRNHFKGLFSCDEGRLETFDGPGRKLQNPISTSEVSSAAKSLKNGKAIGPDQTSNEWLKYADPSFYERYANIINSCFEHNKYPKVIGEAIITPLPKSGKPAGPL